MRRIDRLIAAAGAANLADGMASVAWLWAGSLMTRDALWLGVLAVALRLPWFLAALPAGVIVDRTDRRRLIALADCLRAGAYAAVAAGMLLALPLPSPAASGVSLPWAFAVLTVGAFAIGVAEVLRDNAAQSYLPLLVGRAGLERANGRLWAVELLSNGMIGPALGAWLIALALWAPFAANAVVLLAAAGLILSIRPDPPASRPQPSGPRRHMLHEIAEGWRFLMAQPLLRHLAVTTGFWNLCYQAVAVALVLHVQENMGLGARSFGLILAAGSAGGILGSLAGPALARHLGPGRTAQWMLAASAAFFLSLPFLPGPVPLAAALVLFMASGMIWNVVSVSYRQRLIPAHMMGRVNSLYRLLAWGMMPVGAILSGLAVRLAETTVDRGVALTAPFWMAGAIATALTIWAWGRLGRGFAAARAAE